MVFSALAGWLGILAIPALIMVICNLIDYATGLAAGPNRGQTINSYKSIKGITKKVCMWLLVVVGALIDQLLIYAGDTVGITLPFKFLVACVVAIWIICNEIISILENIVDIGVELPPFLAPIVKNIKRQVEDKAKIKEDIVK
jgi:toxin secretion/phage lysis holin